MGWLAVNHSNNAAMSANMSLKVAIIMWFEIKYSIIALLCENAIYIILNPFVCEIAINESN